MQAEDLIVGAYRKLLEWMDVNRDMFSFARVRDPSEQLLLLKPFSEFVLCVDVLLSNGAVWSWGREHLQWAWNLTESGNLLFRMLIGRPDMCQLSGLYACFHRWGFCNRRLHDLIGHVYNMRTVRYMETELWVRLGTRHALASLGFDCFPDKQLTDTWGLNLPEPWTVTDKNAYALTHEVFYVTDFGRKASALGEKVHRYLELWLPTWVEYYRMQPNWDLVAEFIMVAECLGRFSWPEEPILWLVQSQNEDGHIPGPKGAGSQLIRKGTSEEETRFLSNYHTTLVACMALSLRLRGYLHEPDE